MRECAKLHNIIVVMQGQVSVIGDNAHDKLLRILLQHNDIICVEHDIQDSEVCYVKDDNHERV